MLMEKLEEPFPPLLISQSSRSRLEVCHCCLLLMEENEALPESASMVVISARVDAHHRLRPHL